MPIVDVMQLLHQTRKSGILRVRGRKGESRLVFKDGYIVSANHLNNSIRIGKVLVDLNIITPETLDKALKAQCSSGTERKPLIITLVDLGIVNEKDAYKGLEHLVEIAVVEILTWKKGSFALEALPCTTGDFSFYPEKLLREINVNTQGVLMDALRIFDEKKRDGELGDEEPEDDIAAQEAGAASQQGGSHGGHQVNEVKVSPEAPPVIRPRNNNTFQVGNSIAAGEARTCLFCQYAALMYEACPHCGERHVAPPTVRYTGRAAAALGVFLLCYGIYGLTSYYGNEWQTILSQDRPEPVSRVEVFFRLGFLPWLFSLFGGAFLTVVGRFLLLRDRARKEMQWAAWGGIAVCAAYETAEFMSWVRIASSPSFSYCAVGLASSLLMAIVFSVPFLALLWYLQSRTIARHFPY